MKFDWVNFLIGWNVAWIVVLAASFIRRKKRNLDRESEFVRGWNVGAKNHARWINAHTTIAHYNGFALSCEKCDYVFGRIQDASEEYVRCPQCKHRMPAPLAPEKEVKHEH